ncbi:MAG: metallophosphoesterase [Alphaproteobacteria bacterium]|nr:metallophosphoesterase [Alphaproteobacteria bacterium]
MVFQIVHTGDWHIAKPYGRFDPDKGALLRAARMEIIDRVGDLARSRGIGTVLVAGDVFDSAMVSDDLLRRVAVRLESFSDITWHFLPGNHDPSTINGLWRRFERIAATNARVVIHHEAGLHHIADGVDLLAAPLHARAVAHDPTQWMADKPGANGVVRIGLAHGAVQGFGSAQEASVRIAPDRAVTAGLDYLALGDWHGMRRAGPKAWYAGTPEADQFADNDPGFALVVTVHGRGSEPDVEPVRLSKYRWRRHHLSGDLSARLGQLERDLRGGDGDPACELLRLQFDGRIGLAGEVALREGVDRLSDIAFHVEADYSKLNVTPEQDGANVLEDPLLAAISVRLGERMAAGGESGEVAHRAALLLNTMVRNLGEPN